MTTAPLTFPKEATLVLDPKAPRLTAQEAALTLQCLVRADAPRKLTLHHTSGARGKEGEEWVDFSSMFGTGFYRWQAWVRFGAFSSLFQMTTPKGSNYEINRDSGNPSAHLSIEDCQRLTALLLPLNEKTVEVVPCWILAVNGARPYAAALYYDKGEAEEAAIEQREHYARYNGKSQSTEKPKKAPAIAFNKRTAKKK